MRKEFSNKNVAILEKFNRLILRYNFIKALRFYGTKFLDLDLFE